MRTAHSFIIICVSLLAAIGSPISAGAQNNIQSDEVEVLTVGVYLINIGKIDL
jgi:hypothetical protein